MKPLNNNILIEIERAKDKTKSGLIIPDAKAKELEQGKVIALGKEVHEIKKGDKIVFKKFSTDTVEIDGKEYSFIKGDDVLAIL